MKKLVLISMVAFLFALLTVGTGTAVAATYPNANCLACHGPGGSAMSRVNFTVPVTSTGKVDKTKCIVCHNMGGHSLWLTSTQVWKNGVKIGNFKSAASIDFDPVTIHEYHSGNRPKVGYGCSTGRCHQRAACQSCHGSVSHNPHGSLTSPMVMVGDGNGAYTGSARYGVILQACANDFCHKSYAVEAQPYCAGCHDGTQPQFDTVDRTLGHGGYDATQHNASNMGMGTTYRNNACNKCHVTELLPEHVKTSSSSAAASCNACHPKPRDTLYPPSSLPTWNKSCSQGGCHTVTSGAGSVHTADEAKHTLSPSCAGSCHNADVSLEHQKMGCATAGCHTGPNTVPTTTSCGADNGGCHSDKTPINHGGYDATQHTASYSGTSCFSGGCHTRTLKEEHDNFYARVPGVTNSCQLCHTVLTVTGQTQTWAVKAKAAGGGKWDKTCEACHGGSPHKLREPYTCASCHEHSASDIHGESDHREAPCTTCHGPEAPGCVSCHEHSVSDIHSEHNDVGCTTCHVSGITKPHQTITSKLTSNSTWISACQRCHGRVHNRGSCGYCHNPGQRESVHNVSRHMSNSNCGYCHNIATADKQLGCLLCHPKDTSGGGWYGGWGGR